MSGEIPRSRFLERQEQQFRAGARLLGAAALLLASFCVAGFVLFAVSMRGFGDALVGRRTESAMLSAASVPPWLLIGATVALAVIFIAQHRWLWPALGAWLAALALTTAAAWVYYVPHDARFATLFTAVPTALGAAVHWAVRRFGPPAA